MTVTYTVEVATAHSFANFTKLLFRWRGSIYKLVWVDLVVFMAVYYLLGLVYRFALNREQQIEFEYVVEYFRSAIALIPLSFVLGFFVSLVMKRFWQQYVTIPWPEAVAVYVSAYLHGQDERARLMRRTIMRYVTLTQAIVFSMISSEVKKRFPTYASFVDAGLMVENERLVFESIDESFPTYSKYWMPIVWATSIVARARKEGRIRDDIAVKTIADELNKFRGLCGTLLIYDAIPIPLVYTQVVTIAVYSFFLGCILGMQWTIRDTAHELNEQTIDYYVPIFTILQFFFYMGWLKVAESLINPFGEDDDDFELNWMIDRNLQVSYLIVDEMHQKYPELIEDQYWDQVFPSDLPYDTDVKHEEVPGFSALKASEGRPTMTNVVVNGSGLQTTDETTAQNIDQPEEGQREQLKRVQSMAAMTSSHSPTSALSVFTVVDSEKISKVGDTESFLTAASTIVNVEEEEEEGEGEEVPRKNLTLIPDRSEEEMPSQRAKIIEGTFESPTNSEFDVRVEKSSVIELEPEGVEGGKTDFDRLKEERERERIERQRQRFVQNKENATQIAIVKRERPLEDFVFPDERTVDEESGEGAEGEEVEYGEGEEGEVGKPKTEDAESSQRKK